MLRRFSLVIGLALACPGCYAASAIADLPSLPARPAARLEENTPLCYIQFQGSSAINVTNVCGKKPGEASSTAAVASPSNVVAPPVFNSKENNASTTGQCNFVDANGNPCTQNRDQ
ncbi:MAG: hypothetical protein KME45_29295 [Stenomitos rutilans HA7619-LM2]|nr:hypothetical protein [Stenomitos rutilans HA7619-LM2]